MRKGIRLPPLIHGGGQEKGLRSGTENVGGAVGMATALKESVDEMEVESKRLSTLRDRVLDGLSQLPCTKVTGDREHRLPGTASLVFEGVEGEALLLHLDARGIRGSSGSACSSASLDPSHVLLATGLPHEVAHGSLRLSLGRETTDEDVDYILEQVPQVVNYLREMSPVWDAKLQKPVWYN
jgi:cysteine desulfurase